MKSYIEFCKGLFKTNIGEVPAEGDLYTPNFEGLRLRHAFQQTQPPMKVFYGTYRCSPHDKVRRREVGWSAKNSRNLCREQEQENMGNQVYGSAYDVEALEYIFRNSSSENGRQ
jgi:hypothetical protein